MAPITRCDGCGQESKGGRQWLRVRIEPYYPRGQAYSKYEDSPEVAYAEGMVADACGPQCAALALSVQAGVIAGNYGKMSDALWQAKQKMDANEAG